MGWVLEDLVRVDKSYPIKNFPFKMGRYCLADIICHDVKISRNHAEITTKNGRLFITDHSSNGVFVNDNPLERFIPFEINNNDKISLGINSKLEGNYNSKELFIYKVKVDGNHLFDTPPTSTDTLNEQENEVQKQVFEIKVEDKYVSKVLESVPSTSKACLLEADIKFRKSDEVSKANNTFSDMKYSNELMESLCVAGMLNKNQTIKMDCDNRDDVRVVAKAPPCIKNDVIEMIPQDNDIIVIDDDDNDLLLSQLYVKSEVELPFDEDFVRIKQEIADMDKYDSECLRSPIPVDDEDSSSIDNEDLMNLLLSQSFTAEPGEKSPELLFEEEEPGDERMAASSTCLTTNAQLKDLKGTAEVIKTRHVKSKLQVIPALPITHKASARKRKREEAFNERKSASASTRSKGKKKEKEKESEKKSKNSEQHTSGSDALHPESASHTNGMKSPCREKLKELHKSIIAPAEIKTLQRRGSCPLSPPAAEPKDQLDRTEKSAKIHRLQRIPKLTFKAAEAHMAPLATSNLVSNSSKGTNSATDNSKSLTDPRLAKQFINLPNSVTYTHKPMVCNKITARDRIDKQERAKEHVSFSSGICTTTLSVPDLFLEHKAFIMRLCTWQNSYFSNAAGMDITAIWEFVDGKLLTKLPEIYSDYRYYQSAMQTVVLCDLFNDVYQDYNSTPFLSIAKGRNNSRFGMRATIANVNQHSDYTELACYYYITDADVATKLMDFSLLNFIVSPGPNRDGKIFFGIVGCTYTTKVHDTNAVNCFEQMRGKSVYTHKHTFSVIIRKNKDVQANSDIMCRNFGSIRRHLNKLSAISMVTTVAHQILKPNAADFVIPEVSLPEKPQHFLSMNSKQERIVEQTLRFCMPQTDSSFLLVQGPPGTGKSDLVVNIVLNLLKNAERRTAVLLLAQSNAAVDNLMRRIDAVRKNLPEQQKHGVKMVRLGQRNVIAPDVRAYHVDDHVVRNLRQKLFAISPHLKETYRVIEQELIRLNAISSRSETEEALFLQKQMDYDNFVRDHYLRQYRRESARARDLVFERANLICSTIGSSYSFPNKRIQLQFKCCIIDEATQATEPDTLIPLTLGVRKFILVGDTEQLPAHNNLVPKEYLFSRSLFARLQMALSGPSTQRALYMLEKQYRMREEICAFPNRWFYQGKLITVERQIREDIKSLFPYLVFELNDCHQKATTYVNYQEIDAVLTIVSLISKLQLRSRLTIGIITPYNDQRNEFEKKLPTLNLNPNLRVQVQTIDSFQGQEQDIILLSLVLKLSNKFLDDAQRLNVALTRAKCCLFVLGSSILFKSGSLLRDLQIDALRRGVYVELPRHCDSYTLKQHIFI